MEVLATIRKDLPTYPTTQKNIGAYILDHSHEAVKMSISTLAESAGVKSGASIVKFYRNLGFHGYHEFVMTLATEIANDKVRESADKFSSVNAEDTVATIRDKVFISAMHVLEMNNTPANDAALAAMATRLKEAGRIIIIGTNTSAMAAEDFSVKLCRLGLYGHYISDSANAQMILNNSRKGDLLFCFSYSGAEENILQVASTAKGKVPILAVCGQQDSPLSELADICYKEQSFKATFRSESIVGRYVKLAIVDTLYTCLAQSLGAEADEMIANSDKNMYVSEKAPARRRKKQ